MTLQIMTLVRQTQIYPIDLITYLRVDPKLIPHCLILSQDKKKIENILIILRKKFYKKIKIYYQNK